MFWNKIVGLRFMKIKSAHVLDLVQVENKKEEEKRCTSFDNGNSGQSWSHMGQNLKGSKLFVCLFFCFVLFLFLFFWFCFVLFLFFCFFKKELTFNGLPFWFWGHAIRPKLSFSQTPFKLKIKVIKNLRKNYTLFACGLSKKYFAYL